MSHIGLQDSYDPPEPDFDVEAAAMSADRYAREHDIEGLLRTIEGVAATWNNNYGHNDGKLGDCEHNPFLNILAETFYAHLPSDYSGSASWKPIGSRLGANGLACNLCA